MCGMDGPYLGWYHSCSITVETKAIYEGRHLNGGLLAVSED